MTKELSETIWSLTDQQALDAIAALATTLEANLEIDELDTSDFEKLISTASRKERSLHQGLQAANLTTSQVAEAGRSMLQLTTDLGYQEEVDLALRASQVHGRDFGVISGPLILAGLAVVLAYVPVEQRSKVRRLRYREADGSEVEEDVVETETIRVGAAAAEKLSGWWKAMLGA